MNGAICNLIYLKKTNYPCCLSISKQGMMIQPINTETNKYKVGWYSTALNLCMYMHELM